MLAETSHAPPPAWRSSCPAQTLQSELESPTLQVKGAHFRSDVSLSQEAHSPVRAALLKLSKDLSG